MGPQHEREVVVIITLCGSSRFEDWFHVYNRVLSRAGHLVFGMSCYPSTYAKMPFLKLRNAGLRKANRDPLVAKMLGNIDEKAVADKVHRAKICASHGILVLNAFNYLGESTISEIEYARSMNRDVLFIQPHKLGMDTVKASSWLSRAAKAYDVDVPTLTGGSAVETFGKGIHGDVDGVPLLGEKDSLVQQRCLQMITAFNNSLRDRFENIG